jgi:hypothetical protein
MTFTKTSLFVFLFLLFSAPFVVHKLLWLAGTVKTVGEMGFVGKSYTGTYVHQYANIRFIAGNDTIWFNGTDNILFKEGSAVPVRYPRNNPHAARVDVFASIWGDTLVYGGIPLVILIAVFLHPAVIPAGSRFRLQRRPPVFRQLSRPFPSPRYP